MLLVAMIGAIVLTLRTPRSPAPEYRDQIERRPKTSSNAHIKPGRGSCLKSAWPII